MGIIGTVYPVTNENITLGAVLKNGTIINGESSIGIHRSGKGSDIDHVFLTPQKPKGVEQAIEAILHADVIVLGPGSLYTSCLLYTSFLDIKYIWGVEKPTPHYIVYLIFTFSFPKMSSKSASADGVPLKYNLLGALICFLVSLKNNLTSISP